MRDLFYSGLIMAFALLWAGFMISRLFIAEPASQGAGAPTVFLGAAVAYPLAEHKRTLYVYHYAIDGRAYTIELWETDAVERFSEYLRSLGCVLYQERTE